jgi:hypothetical protein
MLLFSKFCGGSNGKLSCRTCHGLCDIFLSIKKQGRDFKETKDSFSKSYIILIGEFFSYESWNNFKNTTLVKISYYHRAINP